MASLFAIHRIKCLAPLTSAYRLLSDKVLTIEVNKCDVIDNFTSDLVYKKYQKWERPATINKPHNACHLRKSTVADKDLKQLSQTELDNMFTSLIQDGIQLNIELFIKQCQKECIKPSFSSILHFLDTNSKNGSINIICELKKLFDEQDSNNPYYRANFCFDHYLAEAYWVNGEILKALQLFELAYRKQSPLRRRIKMMLRYLISELTTHSEAILVSIIKFSDQIYEEHKDTFPLVCVWQACFLSEWFSDQKLALELLDSHHWLLQALVNNGNLPYVVATSLKQHQVEVVYRMLEVLLKYDFKAQYSNVLLALFHYKFQYRDLKSCSEIIQWSVTYDVRLPQMVHERFLMLLLKRTDIENIKPTKPPRTTINLKF